MKVLQVVRGLRKASGVATFVRELSDNLALSGEQVEIGMCHPDTENWLPPNGPEQVVALGSALATGHWDVVHVHGLWDREIRLASSWALKNRVPLVWSPHGMLAPWSLRFHWWKKCIPWHLWLKRILSQVDCFHVTAGLEEKWLRDLGFGNRIEVIPLGTYVPASRQFDRCVSRFTLLFVGRIHPVKGLENLVRAMVRVPDRVRLRIVGTDDIGFTAKLLSLANSLGVQNRIGFLGPRYGADLTKEFMECDASVLPSFTENFGGVVIDSLAAAKPVIASDATPWKVLNELKLGYWVPNDPETLAKAIVSLVGLSSEERESMGMRGRHFVASNYAWSAVADRMHKVYNTISMKGCK